MANIVLRDLRHTYMSMSESKTDADWALKRLALDWADGGAYALLAHMPEPEPVPRLPRARPRKDTEP